MRYKNDGSMDLLHRIIHRTDGSAFILWTETYLEDRIDQMNNGDRKVIQKAQTLIHALLMDSDALESALGAEAAAHQAARRVNVQQEIEIRDLRQRLEVAERQVQDLRLFLDSGEIRINEEALHPERQEARR